MEIAWGLIVTVTTLVCWGGQVLSWFAPSKALELGLTEAEPEVDPAFWADVRGEALWDTVTLWSMPVAGILLMLDHDAWPYFGLVGGGAYLYFAGRGIIVRIVMQQRGIRIGGLSTMRTALIALAGWGLVAAITIAAASVALT